MRGKAYAIVCCNHIVEISLSLSNAQEILMDYAFEDGAWWYNGYVQDYGHNKAMREANESMDEWRIWEYNLV